MKHKLALTTLLALALPALAQTDPALQAAPADGWGAGTVGGAAATPDHIYTVRNRAQLLNALANAGNAAKIIKVAGTIDMTEGIPFANTTDQKNRSRIKLTSNTTLIGEGPGAGFVNAWIDITSVSQVIVRNLHIVAPCDVGPVWDPSDGATGNWNSAYDAIGIVTATNVWIDRNTLTDDPVSDDTLPIENGKKRQCHDGAIDITKGADLITVSYNVIKRHDKSMLIGGSDGTTSDAGKLRTTISNNVFSEVTQRVPRVRYGQVHVFNNYFAGGKSAVPYPHSYSIGIGRQGQVLSQANVFAVEGAAGCDSVASHVSSSDQTGAFRDSGSTLNGAALGACSANPGTAWAPGYTAKPRPAALVKANALAQAGAGKISTQIAGTGNVDDVAGTRLPANNEANVHTDTRIALSFDAPPVIGSSGTIKVWRTSDDTLVDTLDLSTAPSSTDTQTVLARTNLEIDALGLGAMPENAAFARYVWYRPLTVKGSTASVKLRSNKLDFGTGYYVTMDASVLSGTIKGAAFAGIAKSDNWKFTTRAAPASYTQVSVNDDGGTADFRSLQGALNWVMKHCSTTSSATYGCNTTATPKTITIANGRYAEMNILRRVNNLTLVGESREGVVVGEVNFESLNAGSGASSAAAGTALSTSGKTVGHRVLGGGRAFLIETSDLLTFSNFTMLNPHERSSAWDNQAETIYFNTSTTAAAARLVAKQMNFISQQDTVQLKGYVWFHQSLVAGNVDFIWGSVMAALFEDCEIRSVADPASSQASFILQSRATAGDKGFIFLNSRLTAGPGSVQAYLARSGGTTATVYTDHIAFVNTKMGPHILPAGWCVGTGTSKTGTGTGSCGSNPPSWAGTADGATTDTAGWREFNSMDESGAPLDVSARLGLASVKVANVPTNLVLAKQLASDAGLTDRAAIFFNSTIATGAPGGWAPAP